MKFSEIATRLTGFSIPLFGVSWQPPRSDVAVAKGLIIYLEDRRVLFNPYEAEVEHHVIASLLEIRQELTRILSNGGIANELEEHIRAIRSYCRAFIDRHDRMERPARFHSGFDDYILNQELGALRASIGYHVAAICVRYGINIEGQLATILPQSIAE